MLTMPKMKSSFLSLDQAGMLSMPTKFMSLRVLACTKPRNFVATFPQNTFAKAPL